MASQFNLHNPPSLQLCIWCSCSEIGVNHSRGSTPPSRWAARRSPCTTPRWRWPVKSARTTCRWRAGTRSASSAPPTAPKANGWLETAAISVSIFMWSLPKKYFSLTTRIWQIQTKQTCIGCWFKAVSVSCFLGIYTTVLLASHCFQLLLCSGYFRWLYFSHECGAEYQGDAGTWEEGPSSGTRRRQPGGRHHQHREQVLGRTLI